MRQNSRVIASTVFELLRENQLGRSKITPPPPTQARIKPFHTSSLIFGHFRALSVLNMIHYARILMFCLCFAGITVLWLL